MNNIEKGVSPESSVRSLAALGEPAVTRLEKAATDCADTENGLASGCRISHDRVKAECAELEAAREALAAPIRQAAEWVKTRAAEATSNPIVIGVDLASGKDWTVKSIWDLKEKLPGGGAAMPTQRWPADSLPERAPVEAMQKRMFRLNFDNAKGIGGCPENGTILCPDCFGMWAAEHEDQALNHRERAACKADMPERTQRQIPIRIHNLIRATILKPAELPTPEDFKSMRWWSP
jgi:hypothetical protein